MVRTPFERLGVREFNTPASLMWSTVIASGHGERPIVHAERQQAHQALNQTSVCTAPQQDTVVFEADLEMGLRLAALDAVVVAPRFKRKFRDIVGKVEDELEPLHAVFDFGQFLG